ncbi:MAG: diguanylate phosphodiesterase, partial [Methylobacterium mesophilicum]|nr:diguanylate phosphodiesterase [Methylobacterium mesophilicum]
MTPQKAKELPTDLYIPFVETLFRDGTSLAIGIAAQTLLAGVVFIRTGNPLYLCVALAVLGVGGLRLWGLSRFRHAPPLATREEARARENSYTLWGTLHTLALGFFCFAAIFLAPDPYAETASILITLGSASSIAGRNYGSPRMVMIFVATMIGPISLGFLLRGDVYYAVLGLMAVPFFVAIRRFALTVREVLFAALSEEEKARRIAQRFDRALNTMGHGLVMLGPDGRVAVANAEAARLLAVESGARLLGRSL